jgi:hypothetical protein
MNRQLALKIVLALVGILFLALAYPLASRSGYSCFWQSATHRRVEA